MQRFFLFSFGVSHELKQIKKKYVLCRFTSFLDAKRGRDRETEREKTLINIRQENTCDIVFWGHVGAFFPFAVLSNVYLALLFWQCGSRSQRSICKCEWHESVASACQTRWNHFAFIEYSKASNSDTKRWHVSTILHTRKRSFSESKISQQKWKQEKVFRKYSPFAAIVSICFGLNRAICFRFPL